MGKQNQPQPNASRKHATGLPQLRPIRSRFLWVIAVGMSVGFIITILIAPIYSMAPAAALMFFAAIMSGPFAILLHPSIGVPSKEIVVFGIMSLATFAYLIVPNTVTFAVSTLGAVIWVLLGAFLVMALA